MMNKDELINWYKICRVKGLGPRKIMRLYGLYNSINNVWAAKVDDLLRTRLLKESMLKDWDRLKNASTESYEEIINECNENNIMILPIISDKYPKRLKYISNPPLTLYLQGDESLLKLKKVAIVGSRESDERSKKWSYAQAEELAKNNIVTISGGAKGIDIESHKGALNISGKTISVMGTGLLQLYPEEHKSYFDEIRKKGLLLSENTPNFTGGRIALLQRNRITSGLSDALLASTCSNGGGSMTQLKHAHEQKVPIFCPKIQFDFFPNEGLKKMMKEYKITEIENISPIKDELKKNEIFTYSKQVKLI